MCKLTRIHRPWKSNPCHLFLMETFCGNYRRIVQSDTLKPRNQPHDLCQVLVFDHIARNDARYAQEAKAGEITYLGPWRVLCQ